MAAFSHFFGNHSVAETLAQMIERERIPQTILLSGPEGVGKATLARRFAAAIVGGPDKIERDDLSLAANADTIAEREKWPADKRSEDPLLFATHPDFVTFAPDGPLRQISIQQMRTLRERAQFKPLHGDRRVFLIDQLQRANEQAANSLLKVLEEPPEHLLIVATAENLYDLLPTIRSRSVILQLCRLSDDEMVAFAVNRGLDHAETRIAVAEGCPGIAATIDLEQFQERRSVMLTALECAAGVVPFSTWVQHSESFSNRKSEKLDLYLKLGYVLLADILHARHRKEIVRNRDIAPRIVSISDRVTFSWIERATRQIDELLEMVRRNIQKTAALDAFVVDLRRQLEPQTR
jgi:DNA polymerase-3 subunit delta'